MFEEFCALVEQIGKNERFGNQPASQAPAMLVCAALILVAQRLDAIVDRLESSLPAKF